MQEFITRKNQLLLLVLLALFSTTATYLATAEQPSGETVKSHNVTPPQKVEERNKKFAERLSGVALVGHFSVSGDTKTELSTEKYELQGVMHVKGEMWLFQARIRYGEHDVTLPLTLPVRWAGDTPVICVDKMGFPGLGTYSARVMIYADHYAGFWTGSDHQGHLFGIVKREPIGRKLSSEAEGP